MRLQKSVLNVFLIVSIISCNNKSTNDSTITAAVELDGLKLSKQYCSSCHQYPEPELLTRATWKDHILHRMGYMMGIYDNDTVRKTLIEDGLGGERVHDMNIFPEEPILPKHEWEAIVNYYLEKAPDSLTIPPKEVNPVAQFKVIIPDFRLSPPSTTLAHFSSDGGFYIGDANKQTIIQFNKDLNVIKKGKVSEGSVNLHEDNHNLWITTMGSFSPTDTPSGMIVKFPKDTGKPKIVIEGLQRPVHSSYDDLDGDDSMDIVVSEFGKWTGALSLWSSNKEGSFERTVLNGKSGAIRTFIEDIDQDGLKDIIALFGQGDERIEVYYNKGENVFSSERLITFPPSYGSSFFDMKDINNDGLKDIIYVAGDNGDYPPLMKPYHGIRFYYNDGAASYIEKKFIHINGAYKALLQDFDNDGDIDIAAIAFFPDFEKTPDEGFIYFENKGDLNFERQIIKNMAYLGRWIVMDSGDIDQDGDLDIILGSLTFEVTPKLGFVDSWVKNGIPYVVLENQLVRNKN